MTVFHGNQKLDVIESFLYLGDGIYPSVGCQVSSIARGVHSAWERFHEWFHEGSMKVLMERFMERKASWKGSMKVLMLANHSV